MPEPTIAQLRATIADLQDALETERADRAKDARKTAAIQEKLVEMTKRHHQDVLNANFSRIAHSMGLPAEAIPDVLSGIPAAGWTVNEKDEPEFRDKKSGVAFDDVTPESWMGEQAGPGGRWNYLIRQGAAQGGGQSMPEKNPWSKDGWSDMEQVKIYKASPERAEQLAKAAGSRIGALRPN